MVSLLLIPYFTHLAFSLSESIENHKNWEKHYLLGQFSDTDLESNKIFLFEYRSINGMVDSFTHDGFSTLVAETHDNDGVFKLKFPRNYPYTNDPKQSPGANFLVLENGIETASFTKRIDECHFVFSIPYSGQTQIKIAWTYLLSESELLKNHGDEIPEHCINQTIVDGLRPLHQFKAGVESNYIQCKEEFELAIKSSDGTPACVKPATKLKLIERGWTKSL
ncbi:MAG: hypothetical protein ACRD92_02630 [Nitrosopumilaceae archaeon]